MSRKTTVSETLAAIDALAATIAEAQAGASELEALARAAADTLKGIREAVDQRGLVEEAKRFQEMSMSFNMQYLALQQKIQDESRRLAMLSNIMKTKHDTAKNSISNIR